MGLLDGLKEQMKEAYEEGKTKGKQAVSLNYQMQKKQEEKERVEQLKKEHVPFCPKCHSTSITYVGKKLSLGRAIVGGAIAGKAGAVLGGLSSKKGKVKCLNCGHTWKL